MPHSHPLARLLSRLSPSPVTHPHSPARLLITTCNPPSSPKSTNALLSTITRQKLPTQHYPLYARLRSIGSLALHQQALKPDLGSHGTINRCRFCSTPIKNAFEGSMTIAEKCKCTGCGALVPVDLVIKPEQPGTGSATQQQGRLDYFGLFGIERTFVVDPGTLKRAFHRWQQVVHPDFIGSSKSFKDKDSKDGKAELEGMKQWSMLVNRAKDVLSDDLRRAEYLIGLDGRIELSQEADSSTDTELLMEVMEIHQQLEEAETTQEIEQIKLSNQQSITKLLETLNQKFNSLNEKTDQIELENLKRLVIRLRYLKNIDQLET